MTFRNVIFILSLLAAFVFLQPNVAYAESQELTPDSNILFDSSKKIIDTYYCKPIPGQFTQTIIDCIEKPIRKAVLDPDPNRGLLAMVSKYMMEFLFAAIVLTITIFGIRLMTGQRNAINNGFGLLIRIGVCLMLTYSLYGFGDKFFDIFYQISTLTNIGESTTPLFASTNTITPWMQIDGFLGKLLGFASDKPNAIREGIAALLSGSLLSKNLGIMITIAGTICVVTMLLFIFQAVYLYLISLIVFGMLVVISPIVFALYIFQYRWTDRFMTKWFDIVLSTMLAPLLMFAFLSLFLDTPVQMGPSNPGIFTRQVDKIFDKLGGTDYVQRCLRTDVPFMSSWLLPANNSMADVLACPPPLAPGCDQENVDTNSMQTFVNPYLNRALNYAPLNVPLIDCGAGDERMKIEVYFALVELLFYALVVNIMLRHIPDIAQDLANGVATGAAELASPINRVVHSMMNR